MAPSLKGLPVCEEQTLAKQTDKLLTGGRRDS